MSSAIIVDVETNSLFGEVIELAYATVEGAKISNPVSMRFKPSGAFDPKAVAVNRILPEDVRLCPPSSTAMARLPVADYWIGHNIVYDWERLGRPPGIKLVCTLRLAEIVWPKLNEYKLSSLYLQLFGVSKKTVFSLEGLHGAKVDVKITANVLWRLMKDTSVSDVSQFPFITNPDSWKNEQIR